MLEAGGSVKVTLNIITEEPFCKSESQVFLLIFNAHDTPYYRSFQLDLTVGVEDGEEPYVLSSFDAVSEDEEGYIYLSSQRDGELRIFWGRNPDITPLTTNGLTMRAYEK